MIIALVQCTYLPLFQTKAGSHRRHCSWSLRLNQLYPVALFENPLTSLISWPPQTYDLKPNFIIL